MFTARAITRVVCSCLIFGGKKRAPALWFLFVNPALLCNPVCLELRGLLWCRIHCGEKTEPQGPRFGNISFVSGPQVMDL